MAQQLIQNVVDIMDNAHSQQQQLTESMNSLSEAKQQVNYLCVITCVIEVLSPTVIQHFVLIPVQRITEDIM